MIKTGIYNIQDVGSKGFTLFRKELKNVSITLYDTVIQEPNADELAERILFLFADERGVYKRTYAKRFEEFDKKVLENLKKTFRNEESLVLQDVGTSDGRTALDFFEKVSLFFPNLEYIASDYNSTVYILEKNKCKVTLSHTNKILEILWPPFVFNTIKRDSFRHYPLNQLILAIVRFLFVRPLLKNYKSGMVQAKKLMLFAPQVLRAAKNDPRFILMQHDLLQPFKKQAHIIRAMNILNPSYFSETECSKVICYVHSGLRDGGLLITGSNQEMGTMVHGGIYKKTEKGFEKIEQSGDGSPVDELILNLICC
jgi:hypothetical protein